jgi:hypothetical protein
VFPVTICVKVDSLSKPKKNGCLWKTGNQYSLSIIKEDTIWAFALVGTIVFEKQALFMA